MVAGAHDLVLEQGASFRLSLTWNQAAVGSAPAVPHDLTDAVAHMQVRTVVGGTTLVDLDSEVGDGITLGGALGTIVIFITGEQTELITVKKGVWDIFVTFPDRDEAVRVLAGKVAIIPAVTQPVAP